MNNEHYIKHLASRAPEWMEYYGNWAFEINKGLEKLKEAAPIKELIILKEYKEVKDSLNFGEIFEFLRFVWLDKSFGSVGQGRLGENDALGFRIEELYNITRQMLLILKVSKSSYDAYWKSDKIFRSGQNLRAVKLRALVALTDLKVTCLFYDKFYNQTLRFLGLDCRYPDSELQDLLAEYLPDEYKKDPVAIYIFVWIVYGAAVARREDEVWLLDGMSDDNPPIVKEPEIIYSEKNKYGVLKSTEFDDKLDLSLNDIGIIPTKKSDSNLRKSLHQIDANRLLVIDPQLKNTFVVEVIVQPKYSTNGSIAGLEYQISEIFILNNAINDVLVSSSLPIVQSLLIIENVYTPLTNEEYTSIIKTLNVSKVEFDIPTSPVEFYTKGNAYAPIEKEIEPKLGVKEIANKLSEQIKKLRDEEGQVVGVFGRWGRGKTFLIKQLCKTLDLDYFSDFQPFKKERNFHLVKIHAWKYKEEHTFWAYLYETIAEQYYMDSKNPLLCKPFRIAKLNLNRLGLSKSLLLILPFIFSLAWWLTPSDCKSKIVGLILGTTIKFDSIKNIYKTIIVLAPLAISFYMFKRNVFPKASKLFTTISKKHSFKDLLGFQALVQDELRILLKTWIKHESNFEKQKRLLIIVDDLDRCDYKNIVPIADALRIILEDQEIIRRTIVVTLVDENILANAIKLKYQGLGHDDIDRVREYMDKLFLTGIKLPDLLNNEKIEILNSITKNLIYVPSDKDLKSNIPRQDENDEFEEEEEEIPVESVSKGFQRQINTNEKVKPSSEDILIEDEIPSNYQITQKEKDLLDQYVIHLANPTPRQIKIFYYRYLFIKLLDETEDFKLSKKMPPGHFNEFAIYSIVSAHLEKNNKEIILPEKLGLSHYNNIDEGIRAKFKILVDMVVPY